MTGKRSLLILAFALLPLLSLPAQDAAASSGSPFSFGFDLGTDSLPVPGDLTGATENYQRFGFSPELSLGKFGIGLDLALRMKLVFSGPDAFKVYAPDWVPNYLGNGRSFLEVYLPKFKYVRYGLQGDPLFVKFGSIDDMSLGNGFIMGNYSNTRFLPDLRKFGASFGLDGNLFGFPYLGIEAAVGDVAVMDVLGGRFYVRPLAWAPLPVLKDLQVGAEAVIDRDPNRYAAIDTPDQALVWGLDARLPIIGGSVFPMTAMADLAFQEGGRTGGMTGIAGRLFGVIIYDAQIRYLTDGFIPDYFDSSYDLYRASRLGATSTASSGDVTCAWYAKAGCSLMEDKIVFAASLDGPFKAIPAVATGNQADYPHLRASVATAEGLIGGFSLTGSYEKFLIGSSGDAWGDLISPLNAQIQAKLDYKTGGAILSLLYNLRYNPLTSDYDVTSSLQTSFKF